MGLFDQFVGGAPPTEEELNAVRPAERTPGPAPNLSIPPSPRGMFDQFIGGAKPLPGPRTSFDAFKPGSFNKQFGELKPADVTPTQEAKWATMNAAIQAGMKPDVARHLTEAGFNIGSMLTPMGAIMSAADFTYNAPRGNILAATLDAAGAIPGITAAKRGYQSLRGTMPEVIPAFQAPFRVTTRDQTPVVTWASGPGGRATEVGGFVTPTGRELHAAGSAGYKGIEQAPLVYHPQAMPDSIRTMQNILPSSLWGDVHTPEMAPAVFSTLDRFGRGFGGNRPVQAYDFDALRKQLQGVGRANPAEAPAARQAVEILDTYMLNPPPGMLLQGQNYLPQLQEAYAAARGNWRAYKTGDAVSDVVDKAQVMAAGANSGANAGNLTRQGFRKYVATPEGEAKLFGATPAQLDAIENVVAGDRLTNQLRARSNNLMGGGGGGQTVMAGGAGSMGYALAHSLGMDPLTSAGIGIAAAGVPTVMGGMLRSAANMRTARAGEEVANEIRRASPLYDQNLADATARGMGAMADPRIQARDRITMYLMPGIRNEVTNEWNKTFVPEENQ